MQQLSNSPFLQALGYAILNSFWQFALLWLIYVCINVIRKLNSHQKYITGLVFQIAGFTWFIGTLYFYYNQCLALVDSSLYQQQPFTYDLPASAGGKEKLLLWIAKTEQLLPYLAIAYLLLLLFLTVKWIHAYKYTQKVKTEGLQKIDAEWRLFVQQLSLQLGISRDVKIYLSELVKTPLTIGFYKPLILIPCASINHLTTEQMEAVIIHELAHIKRFDYLLNLFLAAIEAVMFFNPFMQLISVQIKRERENCCDDWVLQFKYNATSYARALLQIATHQTASPAFALKAADNKQALLNRIKRMIERKERTFFNYRHQLLALIVITTVLCTLALLPRKNNIFSVNTNGILTPLAAQVDHPLFNPVFFLLNADVEPALSAVDKTDEKIEDEILPSKTPEVLPIIVDNNIKIVQEEKKLFPVEKRPLVPLIKDGPLDLIETVPSFEDVTLATINDIRIQEPRQNKLKNFARIVFNDKKELVLSKVQILQQLESALDQLKTFKLEQDERSFEEAVDARKKGKNQKQEALAFRLKKENWKQIVKDIEQQIENAKDRVTDISYSTTDENSLFTMRFPTEFVPATAGKPQSYSFEFSEKATIKMANPQHVYPATPARSKEKKTKCEIEEIEEDVIESAPSQQIFLRSPKRVQAIRI